MWASRTSLLLGQVAAQAAAAPTEAAAVTPFSVPSQLVAAVLAQPQTAMALLEAAAAAAAAETQVLPLPEAQGLHRRATAAVQDLWQARAVLPVEVAVLAALATRRQLASRQTAAQVSAARSQVLALAVLAAVLAAQTNETTRAALVLPAAAAAGLAAVAERARLGRPIRAVVAAAVALGSVAEMLVAQPVAQV